MRKREPTEFIPPLPSDQVLKNLFETAFYASMKAEENRAVRFRLAYSSTVEHAVHPRGKLPLPFDYLCPSLIEFETKRGFNVNEILRLAPAIDPTKTMILVGPSSILGDSSLEIQGLLDVGKSWWSLLHGYIDTAVVLPPSLLTISAIETGSIILSRGGLFLLSLRDGKLWLPVEGILDNSPIADFFSEAKNLMHKEVCSKLKSKTSYPKESEISEVYINNLQRLLFNIREQSHGGTLIVVPDHLTTKDPRLTDRLSIKYPCEYDVLWEILIESILLNKKQYSKGELKISPKIFREYKNLEFQNRLIKDPIFDSISAISKLANVDGALVITDKFRLLGFGAEVIASSPSLKQIMIPGYISGGELVSNPTSIESFGTRHRSAFRFCSNYEKSVAFVFSQDGGVKAITRVGPDVVMWSDIFSGGLSI
jgi:hypothetical protein